MEMLDITYSWFHEALKYIRKKKGRGFQVTLALETGLEEGSISSIISGRKRASFDTQVKIAKAAEMDYPEFLMFGRQLFEGKPVQICQSPQQDLIVDVIDGFEKINLEEHAEHYRGIPLYESGKLAPGAGGYSFDEKPASTMVVYQPEIQARIRHDLRALRVKGDSMWPRIPEGAIVIVDLNDRKFVDRQIYVVRDPNSEPPTATIRRICKADQKHFKGLALVSENPEYLPEMTDLDWHELIVGRAVWMWRNLENA